MGEEFGPKNTTENGTTDATVVNGGVTSSFSALATTLNPPQPLAIDVTVTNGGTTDATVVNGGAISSFSALATTLNPPRPLAIDATVTHGGTIPIYMCESDIYSLTIVQIKQQRRARGLRLGGNKALLKERLIGSIAELISARTALPDCNICK